VADVSIIELIVYGIVCYSGIVMLIASAFQQDSSISKSMSGTRVIWLIPSMFCAFMLASAGADIYFEESTVTLVNVNTTETWTETTQDKITLYQPVWVTLHLLFFIIILLYVIFNLLSLFFKRD
jgi:hypothetical protein